MGYTYEGKKAVIWTSKVFESWEYPFQDEGENYTYFYKNFYDKKEFLKCLGRLTEDEKKSLVSKEIGISVDKFILKSKKSHNKQRSKA